MLRAQGDWRRVSKARPCPVCERPDWCLYAGHEDSPTAAICARIESGKRCGGAGWLHLLRDDGPAWPPRRLSIGRVSRSPPIGAKPDFARLAASYAAAVRPEAIDALAKSLGVSAESLTGLGIGWSAEHRAWSFPMSDAGGRIVGIRLRLANGRKLAVKGGKEGLFVPTPFLQEIGKTEELPKCLKSATGPLPPDALQRERHTLRGLGLTYSRSARYQAPLPSLILVCEGPSDTAALLDIGFAAVGRPSCTGGVRLMVDLVGRLLPEQVVVVADSDAPGQRGAESLAAVLTAYVAGGVRVITPPSPFKDGRAWVNGGATAATIAAAIDAAPLRHLEVRIAGKGAKKCPQNAPRPRV